MSVSLSFCRSFPKASHADHTLNPAPILKSNTDSLSENTLPHNPRITTPVSASVILCVHLSCANCLSGLLFMGNSNNVKKTAQSS